MADCGRAPRGRRDGQAHIVSSICCEGMACLRARAACAIPEVPAVTRDCTRTCRRGAREIEQWTIGARNHVETGCARRHTGYIDRRAARVGTSIGRGDGETDIVGTICSIGVCDVGTCSGGSVAEAPSPAGDRPGTCRGRAHEAEGRAVAIGYGEGSCAGGWLNASDIHRLTDRIRATCGCRDGQAHGIGAIGGIAMAYLCPSPRRAVPKVPAVARDRTGVGGRGAREVEQRAVGAGDDGEVGRAHRRDIAIDGDRVAECACAIVRRMHRQADDVAAIGKVGVGGIGGRARSTIAKRPIEGNSRAQVVRGVGKEDLWASRGIDGKCSMARWHDAGHIDRRAIGIRASGRSGNGQANVVAAIRRERVTDLTARTRRAIAKVPAVARNRAGARGRGTGEIILATDVALSEGEIRRTGRLNAGHIHVRAVGIGTTCGSRNRQTDVVCAIGSEGMRDVLACTRAAVPEVPAVSRHGARVCRADASKCISWAIGPGDGEGCSTCRLNAGHIDRRAEGIRAACGRRDCQADLIGAIGGVGMRGLCSCPRAAVAVVPAVARDRSRARGGSAREVVHTTTRSGLRREIRRASRLIAGHRYRGAVRIGTSCRSRDRQANLIGAIRGKGMPDLTAGTRGTVAEVPAVARNGA